MYLRPSPFNSVDYEQLINPEKSTICWVTGLEVYIILKIIEDQKGFIFF